MSTYSDTPITEKPGMVTAIAIMTLINGIINIMWGLSITTSVVFGTFFLGAICAPVTFLPAILGIFEIIYALKLLSNTPQLIQPSIAIAILEIIAVITGNVLSAIVGILVLIFYNDLTVKYYFSMLIRQPIPPGGSAQTVAPMMPAQPIVPEESKPMEQILVKPQVEPHQEDPKQAKKVAKSKTKEKEQPEIVKKSKSRK
jgi:hypothetical protein